MRTLNGFHNNYTCFYNKNDELRGHFFERPSVYGCSIIKTKAILPSCTVCLPIKTHSYY